MDSAETKRFRYLVIELILATDLKRHFEVLSEFGAKAKSSEGLDWEAEGDKMLVSQMLLKVADINSPTKPFDLHAQWTDRITQEFYVQGEAEKALSLPVSPYMSRDDAQVPKLQDSFIAHLVSPLIHAAADAGLLPLRSTSGPSDDASEEAWEEAAESELVSNMHANHVLWKDRLPPEEEAEAREGSQAPEDKDGEMSTIEERDDEEEL